MSRDKALIEAFNNDEDIHKATAARVLGISEEEITSEQRSRAKAVNFGIIYGMSAFGLSTEIHVSRKEAETYINNYFQKHENVKKFMDEQVKTCKEKGFVRTILGRKRRISEITASNYMVRQLGERLAMNSSIQGSATSIAPSEAGLILDEVPVELTAYTINGNNYFKLRDLCALLGIGVTYSLRNCGKTAR